MITTKHSGHGPTENEEGSLSPPCFSATQESGGFTLLEVLLASLILSMVIVMAVWAYSSFLNSWQERNLQGSAALDKYRKQLLMRQALESASDYYVTDPTNERVSRYYPFFKGTSEGFEFITLSSVFRYGSPALARLRLVRESSGEDASLVYEETPLDTTYIRYYDELPEYQRSFEVASDILDVQFRYYGLEMLYLEDDLTVMADEQRSWFQTFEGRDKKVIPEKIEIMYTSDAGQIRHVFIMRVRNPYKTAFFEYGQI